MSDPDPQVPSVSRKCRRNAVLAIALMLAGGGTLAWRTSHADALLTRIHHGLVICASGAAATQTLPAAPAAPPPSPGTSTDPMDRDTAIRNAADVTATASAPENSSPDLPGMVALQVSQDPQGELVIAGDHPVLLSDALKLSHARHELVMLSLEGAPALEATHIVRAAGMRKQVVIVADTAAEARDALAADRAIIVAFPVKSAADAAHVKKVAGHHPYALYLPSNASSSLFQAAHREADAVIATSPDPSVNPVATQKLLGEPVDIVVTEHPDHFHGLLGGS